MKIALALVVGIALSLFLASTRLGPRISYMVTAKNHVADLKTASFKELETKASSSGSVHVIIGLRTVDRNSPSQQSAIRTAQSDFLAKYPVDPSAVKRFDHIPFVAFETDAENLRQMESDPQVTSIEEDIVGEAALAESIPMVNANVAWSSGYTGTGQTVAIVDSGVDRNHTFLGGRVISEGCYSSNVSGQSSTVCPGGVTESTAVGSGINCAVTIEGCSHGTNVAGIAAGSGASFSGVAKNANIVAIQIFSEFTPTACGSSSSCARYWTSDLIRGLDRVIALKSSIPSIQVVNLSLQTGQQFTSNCDSNHAATKAAVDALRSLGVATIICAGNFSFTNALTAPACISSSISVGSVDDGSSGTTFGVVSNFSDSSPLLHLLAPGRWINSSIPGNLFQEYSGTSMAAPHVTGTFALMRQRYPTASIGQITKAMVISGTPTTDTRNGLVKPRLNVSATLNVVNRSTVFDFDDDGKTDIGITRPNNGITEWWYSRSSDSQVKAAQFGQDSDVPAPADFTNDGKTDIAIFRPSTGQWFVLRSDDFSFFAFPFGSNGDIPVPADYDGDGKTDPAVFRPSANTWFISRTSDGQTTIAQFGAAGDKPVPADYDGDGKADIAVYRLNNGAEEWWLQRSSQGLFATVFGVAGDKAVAGDYTGDGKTDIAVWRPSNGNWFVLRSEDLSFFAFPWGANGDIPAPGDYDGDGKTDAAVFRQSGATWFINRTGGSGPLITSFGAATDSPVAGSYVR